MASPPPPATPPGAGPPPPGGRPAADLLARIAAGRTDLVIDLVAAGAAPTTIDDGGVGLVDWCAYYGDVSALRILADRGAPLEHLGPDLGLGAAAFHGHWTLCQFLLERGAPVGRALPGTGETPLHAAFCSDDRVRYDPVARVLVAWGADPNAVTVPGAATAAFMRDARTRGETPLHRAAAVGTADSIGLLVAAGGRLDAGDANGDTPLAWASWHRRPAEILRLLCFGPHRIHPGHRGLRANLVGDPGPGPSTAGPVGP